MAVIKPFKGVRPPKNLVEKVASRPYDVLSSEEARTEAAGNPQSLYRIIKPEVDLVQSVDEHDESVYQKAAENFQMFLREGWLQQDESENYYLYAQTMHGRTQYGLVLCASIDEYLKGHIRKHELTRHDKEEDRRKHVRVNYANIEPVFLAYPAHSELDQIVEGLCKETPEYQFTDADNFVHSFWVISDSQTQHRITQIFAEIPTLYIADGHHRSAAAARVGDELRQENPAHTGEEEYNYFMAVCFPENQLRIMDYNRLVKDLNGWSDSDFLTALDKNFIVGPADVKVHKPTGLHNFGLYLSGYWYSLTAREGSFEANNPIEALDVTISSQRILDELLDIKDLRTDKRVDFVGGIRGLEELQRRVDSGEMKFALALYPVSMQQLIQIADTGQIMPPKTTWFEPKLRSGLVIHRLRE